MGPIIKAGTELFDGIFTFEKGINSDPMPELLPKNQLAFGVNTTVRGTVVHPRPIYRKIDLTFASTSVQQAFESGLWQGAGYYIGNDQVSTLFASIAGRLYQVDPLTGLVTERTIAGDPNPANKTKAWIWQAENFLIVNDGESTPIFFDGSTTRRSAWKAKSLGQLASAVTVTGNAAPPAVTITLDTPYPNGGGESVYLGFSGYPFTVQAAAFGLTTLQITPSGTWAADVTKSWVFPIAEPMFLAGTSNELPPGRMGVYGMGRVWMALPDGRQFIASDIVGGSSGTLAYQFRDAVLRTSENDYLAGGGAFQVPGNIGDIRAMIFTATLDVSLGQGPLQVLTPTGAFSCMAPTDRTTWQTITNPIMTQSLITNGAVSHWSTVMANGDTLFRSPDGIRSLILGRREFSTWGNTPISAELRRILDADNPIGIEYSSGIVFDNRYLLTCSPQVGPQGIYFRALAALNFDPISSLAGKAPSVYDGVWTGLNSLQLVTGLFNGTQRAFSFCYNAALQKIELYEICLDTQGYEDNDVVPIQWKFETPTLKFGDNTAEVRQFKELSNGEIYIADLIGRVDVAVYYRADQSPCWIPWRYFSEIACVQDNKGNVAQPQFRPRLTLGEPDANIMDPSTNRPCRHGYFFQLKVEIQGHCKFLGGRFRARTMPEPKFDVVQTTLP